MKTLALALLASIGALAQTHDYTGQATASLSAATSKWTLQLPTTATKYARVKSISIQTSGGSGTCAFTVLREAGLATTGTLSTPAQVSAKINGGTVPAAQARFYAGSNSTGGSQVGYIYRLSASQDRIVIPYDSRYMEAGQALTIEVGTCTATVDVMTLHEEYN